MDARTLDVVTGGASLAVFILALIILPAYLPLGRGPGYVLAIVLYLGLMTGAGFLIREKIA